MPDAVELVALGVDGARHDGDLADTAVATGTPVAFLQARTPTLTEELDRLHVGGAERIELVGLALGAATARSWLSRVPGHWRRSHPEVEVVLSRRAVTGREALRLHGRTFRPTVTTCWCVKVRAVRRGVPGAFSLQSCSSRCGYDTWYGGVDAPMAQKIVDQHLVRGITIEQGRLPLAASAG